METYVSIQRFQNIQANVLHMADINYMLFQHLRKHCLYLLKFTTTVYHFKTFIIVSPSCTWSPMHKYLFEQNLLCRITYDTFLMLGK